MTGPPSAHTPKAFMEHALALSREAAGAGEVPVGAVLAFPDGLLFEGMNRTKAGSPLAHAEIEVLQKALGARSRHGLSRATLYVTLEPCLMCLGAMTLARIGGLVYACPEPRFGGVTTLRALWKDERYPHRFPITSGLGADEAKELMQAFFRNRRREV